MFDLIIVGAGPAGLSLSASLAGSGLNIAQVEALPASELAAAPFDGREIALTHPSKKILEQTGIWQNIPPAEIFLLKGAQVQDAGTPKRLHFDTPPHNRQGEPLEALGFLVSNHWIRRAAWQRVEALPEITWFTEKKVQSCQLHRDAVQVHLDSGEALQGRLLIAADSRLSSIRRACGIPADSHDFGRSVIVFRLEHAVAHQQIARECFLYGSTLALLPLSENLTNCVITVDSQQAPHLLKMDGEALAAYVETRLHGELGAMKLASSVHHYPLLGVHARRFYGLRSALIGDAACGMHPVTAHGFNLGLQSQAILARLLLRQQALGEDLGAEALLREYNRRHQLNTRILYHGTNSIVKLFTAEHRPARLLRQGMLQLAERLPPLKRWISGHLTG